MSDYRRNYVPGGSFFFTLVTERRAKIFANGNARQTLGDVMRRCLARHPVDVAAIVLLPDHLHTLWTLPTGDRRYSTRWKVIKREFTLAWLASGGREVALRPAQQRERRRGVWQRRFWEHTVRDEEDWEAHFDYIHFNPVKHGLVARVQDWPWSSFHRWVETGHYPIDWGRSRELQLPGNAGE